MKYKLRFFLNSKNTNYHDDAGDCFATIYSRHVPKKGELIYIGDDSLNLSQVDSGSIYQTVHSIYCFDNPFNSPRDDALHSVEVMVKIADV